MLIFLSFLSHQKNVYKFSLSLHYNSRLISRMLPSSIIGTSASEKSFFFHFYTISLWIDQCNHHQQFHLCPLPSLNQTSTQPSSSLSFSSIMPISLCLLIQPLFNLLQSTFLYPSLSPQNTIPSSFSHLVSYLPIAAFPSLNINDAYRRFNQQNREQHNKTIVDWLSPRHDDITNWTLEIQQWILNGRERDVKCCVDGQCAH